MFQCLVRLAVAVLMLGAVGCDSGVHRSPADVLGIAANLSSMITLDPAAIAESLTGGVMRNVCEPLLVLNEEDAREVMPGIAERWSVNDDFSIYTFHIRPNLTFPSGNPVTAHDVAWSMNRSLQLNLASSKNLKEWGFNKNNIGDMVHVIDDLTLEVKPPKKYSPSLFLYALADYRSAHALDRLEVLSHEVNGDLGNDWLTRNTACYGPFRVHTWRPQDVLILERNENWKRRENPIRRVVLRHIPEPGTQRLMLEKGDIDLASNLDPSDLNAIEKNPNTYLKRTPTFSTIYMAFNRDVPVFSDPRVITAMRYLIDYEAIARTVLNKAALVRESPVPRGMFGALPESFSPYSLNIDKARELLREAGVAEGYTFELLVPNSMPYPEIAQHFQENLQKVGVEVKIITLSSGYLFSQLRARKFQAYIGGYAFNYPDANNVMLRFGYNPKNSEDNSVSVAWRTDWDPGEWFNATVMKAQTEPDPAIREKLYHELQRYHVENSPIIFLFQRLGIRALSRNVLSIKANAITLSYASAVKKP
jgi:peptide/nickel transport system substrate-binding protein